jgi:hypothetical protein
MWLTLAAGGLLCLLMMLAYALHQAGRIDARLRPLLASEHERRRAREQQLHALQAAHAIPLIDIPPLQLRANRSASDRY